MEIEQLVDETSDQVQSIATAAEEQSAASEEINMATDEIRRIDPDMPVLDVTAPLPPHMQQSWNLFGFEEADGLLEEDDLA